MKTLFQLLTIAVCTLCGACSTSGHKRSVVTTVTGSPGAKVNVTVIDGQRQVCEGRHSYSGAPVFEQTRVIRGRQVPSYRTTVLGQRVACGPMGHPIQENYGLPPMRRGYDGFGEMPGQGYDQPYGQRPVTGSYRPIRPSVRVVENGGFFSPVTPATPQDLAERQKRGTLGY